VYKIERFQFGASIIYKFITTTVLNQWYDLVLTSSLVYHISCLWIAHCPFFAGHCYFEQINLISAQEEAT
jgi:hypothetical protein